MEIDFGAGEIFNVGVAGRKVRFTPSKDPSGKPRRPFVFFASDPDAARQIAALMLPFPG